MDINKLNSKQRKLYFMLEEFVNEEDLSKFSTVSTPLKFKNGAYMNLWFKYHKLEIMNNVDSLSLKVQEQFLEYSKNRSAIIEEKEYKNKLKEFCLDANEDKFIKNSKVFFEDKTHKGVWFNNYMDMILFSNDKVSLKIKEQYNAFLKILLKGKKTLLRKK